MAKFYNVTGSTGVTVELISSNQDNENLNEVLLTNVHASNDATVTLFIQDDPTSGATSTNNIIHTVAIPADTSLLLNNSSTLNFPSKFGLYITVGSSDTVDVVIG